MAYGSDLDDEWRRLLTGVNTASIKSVVKPQAKLRLMPYSTARRSGTPQTRAGPGPDAANLRRVVTAVSLVAMDSSPATTEKRGRGRPREIERGDVRGDLDVDTAVTLFAASLLMRVTVEGRAPDEQFAESVIEFIAARAAA